MARFGGDIELHGAKRLERALNKLGGKVSRKVMRSAIGKAATPVAKLARSKAPKETGLLRKSIKRVVRTYKASGTIVAIVGPDTKTKGTGPDGRNRQPVFYAHLVEFGTKPHAIGRKSRLGTSRQKGGRHPGTPAKPFMRPALQQGKAQFVRDMIRHGIAGVEKEAKKLGKRAA